MGQVVDIGLWLLAQLNLDLDLHATTLEEEAKFFDLHVLYGIQGFELSAVPPVEEEKLRETFLVLWIVHGCDVLAAVFCHEQET